MPEYKLLQSYRVLGALLGWFTILTQYWLSTSQAGLVHGSIIYFSYFTMLGNIQVTLAFTAPLLPDNPFSRFFQRPGVRTAIAVYILVVATIYYVLLRKVFDPTGLGAFINILLHYVMPALYLLDWVAFVPKQNLALRQMPYWSVYPTLYAGWTLLHGAWSGYYPYPFMNAAKYGYPQVLINIATITGIFIVLFAAFIIIGRLTSGKISDVTAIS